MPIKRFSSFEEARADLWADGQPDAAYFRRMAELWEMSYRLHPKPPGPQGVFKFRSIEEAQEEREERSRAASFEVRQRQIEKGRRRVLRSFKRPG